jgi:hypothetical protein
VQVMKRRFAWLLAGIVTLAGIGIWCFSRATAKSPLAPPTITRASSAVPNATVRAELNPVIDDIIALLRAGSVQTVMDKYEFPLIAAEHPQHMVSMQKNLSGQNTDILPWAFPAETDPRFQDPRFQAVLHGWQSLKKQSPELITGEESTIGQIKKAALPGWPLPAFGGEAVYRLKLPAYPDSSVNTDTKVVKVIFVNIDGRWCVKEGS